MRFASLYAALKPAGPPSASACRGGERRICRPFRRPHRLSGAGAFRRRKFTAPAERVSALADAAAIFECEVEDLVERHGHVIVIGRVRAAFSGTPDSALLYWRGAYERLGWSEDEISRADRPVADTLTRGAEPPSGGPRVQSGARSSCLKQCPAPR